MHNFLIGLLTIALTLMLFFGLGLLSFIVEDTKKNIFKKRKKLTILHKGFWAFMQLYIIFLGIQVLGWIIGRII